MDDQIQTLINTLMQGGLASSEGEARRMAEDMLGTTAKVQNEYSNRRDENHMFADQVSAKKESIIIKEEPTPQVQPQPQVRTQSQDHAMQNKIEELRNAALNPKPVNVQVDFQTPKTDLHNRIPQQQEHIQANIKIEPEFTNQQVQAAAKSINEMPSVDFNIPGVNTNVPINELNSNNLEDQAPKEVSQELNIQIPEDNTVEQINNQEDFFSQQNKSPSFSQNNTNSINNSNTPNNEFKQVEGISSGFPSENSIPNPSAQLNSTPSSDFIQMKPEKNFQNNNNNNQQNNILQQSNNFGNKQQTNQFGQRTNSSIQTFTRPNQQQAQPNQQAQPQNNQFGQQQAQPQSNPQQQSPSTENQEAPAQKPKGTWTEEEKKLKDEVDLSKIFNFGNK